MKREPSIVTGTLRSHPWQDHSTRVCDRLSERAPAGTLDVRSLEGGFRTGGPALLGSTSPTLALESAVRLMCPPWGEPLELPELDSGTRELDAAR